MKKLTLYPLGSSDELAHPDSHSNLSLESPALAFFTDFQQTEPLVIEGTVAAEEARRIMMQTHVRLQFVIDDKDRLIGVVTADDVMERVILQAVADGYRRNDISVSDLMTPRSKLQALALSEVKKASIGDIVNVLKDSHQQHCLVVDHETGRIRGIFSASDISRKLHLPINVMDKSDFYRVFAAIA